MNTEQFLRERECKPGVDPERSDYRTLRAERGTCFNPLQALITPPQQTECTSSFLHLRPIQAKIKTSITLFEKCSVFTVLKWWKVNLRRREPCNWRESVVSPENFSLWETRELMQRTVCVCVCERDAGADAADGGYLWRSMWILWMTSSLSSHSTSASVSERSRLVNTYSGILAKMQQWK